MDRGEEYSDNIIDELKGLNHLQAMQDVMEMVRRLIITDEKISDETKKRFVVLYMQYKLHYHLLVEGFN